MNINHTFKKQIPVISLILLALSTFSTHAMDHCFPRSPNHSPKQSPPPSPRRSPLKMHLSPPRSPRTSLLVSRPLRDDRGNTPLHLAARRKDLFASQLLLSAQADIHATNINGDTPLHLACGMSAESVELVQLLLQHKAIVDARNKKQCTPLHAAAASGHTETALLLINHKADVLALDNEHQLPLDYAMVCKNKVLCEALIQAAKQRIK